jgi:hypothetical protein
VEEWFSPGQRWQRVAFGVLLPAEIWLVSRWWGASLHGALPVLLGIATFLFGVLSFAPLYRAWLAFGERANRVVIGLLFALIYALVVPLFSLVRLSDRLGLRGRSQRSFWVTRRQPDDTVESMLRMG